jgi:hypothetical protein
MPSEHGVSAGVCPIQSLSGVPSRFNQEELSIEFVGTDQHRKQLTALVWNDRGEVVLRRQVSTQRDKVRAFLDDLNALTTPTRKSISRSAGVDRQTRAVGEDGPDPDRQTLNP